MHELIAGAPLTMSSREIADLVESRHEDVRRSMERLAERGTITLPPLAEVSNDGPGPKTIKVYNVCKRDSYVIVAQLSPEFTARLVDRWQQLEAKVAAPQFQIPQTLPEALRLAADLADQNRQLEAKVTEQGPKVDAFERIAGADGTLCLRDCAKALQRRPIDLTNWMLGHRWIYRRAGNLPMLGYQDKVQGGYLTHKVTTVTRSDGSDKVVEQVRVTSKGLTRLAEAIRADLAAMA